ncbi:hypothetical protein SRHO_G00159610 [Serrasalmus rhombeus]
MTRDEFQYCSFTQTSPGDPYLLTAGFAFTTSFFLLPAKEPLEFPLEPFYFRAHPSSNTSVALWIEGDRFYFLAQVGFRYDVRYQI